MATVLVLLLLPSAAMRNALHNLYISVMERYTQVQLTKPVEEIVSRWKGSFIPTFVPAGFVMSDAINTEDAFFLEYANSNGDGITVYQYDVQSNIRLDTENASEAQDCEISDMTGYLYEKDGLSTLYWSNGERSFSIEFKPSFVAQDEIIKMAESMEQ